MIDKVSNQIYTAWEARCLMTHRFKPDLATQNTELKNKLKNHSGHYQYKKEYTDERGIY